MGDLASSRWKIAANFYLLSWWTLRQPQSRWLPPWEDARHRVLDQSIIHTEVPLPSTLRKRRPLLWWKFRCGVLFLAHRSTKGRLGNFLKYITQALLYFAFFLHFKQFPQESLIPFSPRFLAGEGAWIQLLFWLLHTHAHTDTHTLTPTKIHKT